MSEIVEQVRSAATRRLLFLPHAVRQMSRPERMITPADVRKVVAQGSVIEDYPNDVRGHSCLMLGFDDSGRPIHVVCSPTNEYLAVITAYIASEDEWTDNFSKRKKR